MEIRDSESGDLLIAAIDKKQSSDTRKKDTDKGWAPMAEILDYWAKLIHDRMASAKKM